MFERRLSTQSNSPKPGSSTPSKIKQEPSDDSLSSNSPGVSRYGRSHKPKMQDDFVSTDKKVSAYLKLSPGNQLQNYSTKKEYKKKNSPKKVNSDSEGTPRRGRPPKFPKKVSTESVNLKVSFSKKSLHENLHDAIIRCRIQVQSLLILIS